ncbi:hypothetical protein A2U01_0033029, partial [Trifolium medium]|nr:hypothetical protein [Trifolium medium]
YNPLFTATVLQRITTDHVDSGQVRSLTNSGQEVPPPSFLYSGFAFLCSTAVVLYLVVS